MILHLVRVTSIHNGWRAADTTVQGHHVVSRSYLKPYLSRTIPTHRIVRSPEMKPMLPSRKTSAVAAYQNGIENAWFAKLIGSLKIVWQLPREQQAENGESSKYQHEKHQLLVRELQGRLHADQHKRTSTRAHRPGAQLIQRLSSPYHCVPLYSCVAHH